MLQHTDTSKNTKAWAVPQHTDTSKNTQAWAVSQQIDASQNTKATLKCCHALLNSMGIIFSPNSLLAYKHPPSRNGDTSSEDGAQLPMQKGDKNGHTRDDPLTLTHGKHLSLHLLI